ncbi:hypothetical protein ID866_8727 [Astraeus odoratus]|nr:hypothetical protein ID866_8727 [Astraeus odoratus]
MCPTDTPLSLDKSPGLRESSSFVPFRASQLAFGPAPLSRSWSDIDESRFIALHYDPACPPTHLARDHAAQGGTCRHFFNCPSTIYPSPPLPSKAAVPLPEEVGELAPVYLTLLPGVLDSPAVMRRADFATHRLPTPPPTLPYLTLDLPDPEGDGDVDVPFGGDEVDGSDNGIDDDEQFGSPSESSQSADTDLPLSPISPTWDPQGSSSHPPQLPYMSDSPPESTGHIQSLWAPLGDKEFPLGTAFGSVHAGPHFIADDEPSSLLEIDDPRPVSPAVGIRWSPYDNAHNTPTPFMPFSLLSDRDDLQAPCSPRLPRLSLPEVDAEDVHMSDSSGADSTVTASPSQPLLGLPGADMDDTLLPTTVAAASPPLISKLDLPEQSEPLIFINDPRDVPLVRSPSPDDLKLLSDLPPEGSQLLDMRKRYMAAEKGLPDAADSCLRGEAKRKRKRDLERSKEIGALLCLKFPDKVVKCRKVKMLPECGSGGFDSCAYAGDSSPGADEQQQQPPLPQLLSQEQQQRGPEPNSNIAQLVAQMVFRRNETSRPLPWRKTINRDYVKSPLSRAVVREAEH